MAFMYNEGTAYDISLFETPEVEEKEESNIRKINKKKSTEVAVKKKNNKILNIVLGVSLSAVAVTLTGIIIMGQVQLTELNQQISNAQSTLEEQQSLYVQTQMKVEAKYSSDLVEENAQGNLGMSKADSYQKEYIAIDGGDKAEVSDLGSSNIFENIANMFSGE